MGVLRLGLLGLAGLLVLAALLAQGGRVSSALDVLTSFAAVYLAGGAAVLIVGAVNRRWRERWVLTLLGGVAVIAAAALMTPEFLAARASVAGVAGAGERLKIAQLNLKSDEAWNGRVVDWLIEEDPDVVVLEDLGPNLRAVIKRRLAGRHLTCAQDCNVALLSKTAPLRSEGLQGGSYGLTPRTLLAEFASDHGTFEVVGAHLARPHLKGPNSPRTSVYIQAEQSRQLRGILSSADKDSLILAGDFNSTPWSFARQREDRALGLERRTRFLFSWPANRTGIALLPIDHIYAGSGWRTLSVARGPFLGSDHYPVVAVLTWSRPK